MNNLKTVLTLLKSDKAKDRQQGVKSLREVFGRNSAIEKLDSKGDGRAWLVVFQSLFTAVVSERASVAKKGAGSATATAERRLKDAASALRWLTERSVTRWGMKVAKPLIRHLLQVMVQSKKLFEPIALDYVKALRTVCSYQPHLDHLMTEETQWIDILSLSFNVVLGDELKSHLEDVPEGMSEAEVSSVLSEAEDEDNSSRKRKRREVLGRGLPRSRTSPVASPEQIEFVAIIDILLQSPRASLVSSEHPNLAQAVLDRLLRFFRMYHVETSAHLDAIKAANAVLRSLSLNARDRVINFGASFWDHLLSLWSTKNKSIKEEVLLALKLLFPYVTHLDARETIDRAEGVARLLKLLQTDHDSRWAFDELRIDALRFELSADEGLSPFHAHTFKCGFNFTSGQMIAWTVLELQADCVKELYSYSESGSGNSASKRVKIEDPIRQLLHIIQTGRRKTQALQCLLFVVDRHWPSLHSEVQVEIVSVLLQIVTVDDTVAQSWVLCCFAAVASSEASSGGEIHWDSIWSHTVRRTNAPAVSRAACHASHVLLLCGKVPSNRALAEIEVLGQDITVQGPVATYDSVCFFLALCMKITRQDSRLYRMHLDDKVLAWFIETWSASGNALHSTLSSSNRHQPEQYTMQDILHLLEGICGIKEGSNLLCPIPLPGHPLAELLQDLISTNDMREYLLYARFPRHNSTYTESNSGLGGQVPRTDLISDLVQPEHRERKASAFLLKMLEAVTADWEARTPDSPRPLAESVRRGLDLAALAICFESTLVMNGIRSNRRSILVACNLIKLLAGYIQKCPWTFQEMTSLLSTVLPLTCETIDNDGNPRWEAFLSPTKATGVKYDKNDAETLQEQRRKSKHNKRTRLQRIIWRSTDVQDGLLNLLDSIKEILKSFLAGIRLSGAKDLHSTTSDDKDEFGSIRTSMISSLDLPTSRSIEESRPIRRVIWSSFDILLRASVLQSQEGDATSDKSIIDLICSCSDDERFIEVLGPFLWHVRQRNVRLTGPTIDRLLQRIEGPLMTYRHSRSTILSLASVDLLTSTMPIWLAPNSSSPDLSNNIRTLFIWLMKSTETGDWIMRDSVVRLFDYYLVMDPTQKFFVDIDDDESDPDNLPATRLLPFLKDQDIHVRFTAAKSCARSFSTAYVRLGDEKYDPMTVYGGIRKMLCIDLSQYEHMLTRFICLSNIIIVSSAVRRGPYWHLIETCLYSQAFERHIESVLDEAAKKMGLLHFSELFEAYASQIAYSIRVSQKDVFRLPPHLLGYRDRRECAEATFLAFSPTNLLADIQGEVALQYGQEAFARHCAIIGKTPKDGLRRCFADILGYQLVSLVDEQLFGGSNSMDTDHSNGSLNEAALLDTLQARFITLGLDEELKTAMEKCIDRIVFIILRTNGEMDYRREGLISSALEGPDQSDRTVRAFRTLMKYRGRGEFDIHPPNLPAFGIPVIISALNWIGKFIQSANSPSTTYHILYHFFTTTLKCVLVNEQLRLLTCLCIWISLIHSQFRNPTLLKVLMSGAVSLLPQHDLSAISQGILEWTFLHIKETRTDMPHIVEALIRVCTISQSFRGSNDEVKQATGTQLKDWVETQIVSLSDVDSLRRRIAVALAAWPEDLSEHLQDIRSNLTTSELSAALDDPYLSSNKFKLVKRLSNLASEFDYGKEVFAKHDFWRLKDCMPDCDIAEEEIDAFISLLTRKAGYVKSNLTDQHYGRSIAIRHQKLVMQKDDKGRRVDHTSVKRPIIMALLDMLADQIPTVVDVAYRTLRLLGNIETLDSPEYGTWPSEYRGDIACLIFCPIEGDDERPRKLHGLLQGPFQGNGFDFTTWISGMTVFLSSVLSATDAFFAHLTSVLRGSTLFAEQMFPVLVYSLLQQNHTEDGMSARHILSEYFRKLLSETTLDKRCHRSVVNLILHLRNYIPDNAQDALQYNRWLDLDYVLLSQSAIACGAYTTALLFLELASDGQPSRVLDTQTSERILYEIYSHIDEPDGFYGIKIQNLHNFLLQRFHHEQQWEKAFQFHGADFEAMDGDVGGRDGVVESLQSFGFNHLALITLQCAVNSGTPSSSHLEYQLGWRTESWDLPDPPNSGSPGSNLYNALRAIHREREDGVLDGIVQKALTDELHYLRRLGNEDLAGVRLVTRNLVSLAQIRRWRSSAFQTHFTSKTESIGELDWGDLNPWSDAYDFQDLESVIATRISLVHSMRQKEQREQIGMMQSDLTQSLLKLEKKCLIQLSEAARGANQAQVALNSIIRGLRLESGPDTSVTQEYANVLWLKNEQKLAVEFLKREVTLRLKSKTSKDVSDKMKDALMLAKLGEWTSEACLEKPDVIHKNHFSPAIALLLEDNIGQDNWGDTRATVFHKCAMFAEQQYQAIVRSPDLIRLKVYAERKRQELKEREESIRRSQGNKDKLQELTQHQRKARALYEQDTAQFIEVSRARDTYLHQAIQMLSLCLEASDSYDGDAAIRLCSLWFANFMSEGLTQVIPTALEKVPSRKFVFLAHQLSARLSSQESSKISVNQQALQSLVIRMCTEHPFHSLYQVYALQSGSSSSSTSSRRRSSGIGAESLSQLDRATAASNIFQRLESVPNSDSKVRDVRRLCDAYLEWAKYPIKGDPRITERKRNREPLPIPSSLSIRKISDLRVPVTTVHTPLDPTMRYDDCVWIRGYASNFDTAGGINLPKISYCHGSDGNTYKQLFKGEGDDDLRQDAVMEQAFELCNQVLSLDRETRKRALRMRSYKVIPLAPQAGLLEFVTNTIPMQSWLSVAHARYHPSDMTMRDCTHQLSRRRKENPDTAALVELFREIRRKFRPVLRHFFTERHKVPQAWFEMRLNYSRSVAVSSIIGHVLGLGDRHISNILLDTSSGEVIHIDLGIAFEQGKLLPIAERVPFRLTADIVDGFGMSGTEGVFRRCAEETLRVLRDGSDVIKTVLEVFRYDPLHSWTASAVKVRKVQAEPAQHAYETERLGLGIGIDMDSGMEDEAADRALNGVARKLDKSLSVEYTVNELITEATDESSLAQMFAGWSPFC